MPRAEITPPRRTRLGVVLLVGALHAAALFALLRAFVPDISLPVSERLTSVFTVEEPEPPPEPPPPPSRPKQAEPAGAAAPAGKRATPREAAAPRPKIVLAPPRPAPPVAGQGDENAAGARDAGIGTGGGGQGAGTGSGAGGTGQGGGAARAVKIAGEISSARDYPAGSRQIRLGDHVILALTVGADGRVKGCRIHRPSRDPDADRITCRLATERFRFRPATDAAGRAVESIYGWRQQWYDPREKD